MRDLGGRPHWAKNFECEGAYIEAKYGDQLMQWRKIRQDVDPEGMFLGDWHRRYLLGRDEWKVLPLEEVEVERVKLWQGGVSVRGRIIEEYPLTSNDSESNFSGSDDSGGSGLERQLDGSGTLSQESFDFLRASEIGGIGGNRE